MAVDAITASPNLDTVILITGDGDFVPLVRYLQNHDGCQVEVASFGRSTSAKLKEATDDFLDLDEDPRRYLINYRGPGARRRSTSSRQAVDQSNEQSSDVQVSAPDDSIAPGSIEEVNEIGRELNLE
jgi:hypothetical protein